MLRRSLTIALTLLAALAGTAPAGAQEVDPTWYVFVTYRAPPATRPQFVSHMRDEGARRLAEWQRQGIFREHQLLANSFVDADTWDMMLVLRFTAFSDIARWRQVEREFPGGLTAEALRLGAPINTYTGERAWLASSRGGAGTGDEMYLVIPYEFSSEAEYRSYADAYVIPQFDAWVREGVLTGYDMYLNQYPASKPWDVLIVLEYRDQESLGRREEVKLRVRARLRGESPEWVAAANVKAELRTEGMIVVAEPVVRPPARPQFLPER
jgi:hypothetical protein